MAQYLPRAPRDLPLGTHSMPLFSWSEMGMPFSQAGIGVWLFFYSSALGGQDEAREWKKNVHVEVILLPPTNPATMVPADERH